LAAEPAPLAGGGSAAKVEATAGFVSGAVPLAAAGPAGGDGAGRTTLAALQAQMALQQQALAGSGGGPNGLGATSAAMGAGGGGGGGSSNDAYSALVFSGQRGADWIREALMSTSRATSTWPQAYGCAGVATRAAAARRRCCARRCCARRPEAVDRSRPRSRGLPPGPRPPPPQAGRPLAVDPRN
jgi:hypothetical protein